MAYSTNNTSSVISVTNFGARGDGVTDDSAAIQAAIDSAFSGCGIVEFPAGTFIIGSVLNLTSSGLILRGKGPKSIVKSYDSTLGAIFNITGSNIEISDMTIDGAYTSGASSDDIGLVSIIAGIDITVKDCRIRNSRRAAVRIYGGCVRVKIINSILSNNYVGVRSFSDPDLNTTPTAITIDNCSIMSNWDRSGYHQTGGIKLEVSGYVSVESSGHKITNNYIYNVGLLGIELWGGGGVMSNSLISNNTIFCIDSADEFGISLNDCYQCTAIGNIIRMLDGYVCIEMANGCEQCVVEGNNLNCFLIDGETISDATGIGVFNNVGPGPKWMSIIGNSISGAGTGFHIQSTAINTVFNNNRVREFNSGIVIQQADYVIIKNNKFETTNCSSFLYLDGVNKNVYNIEVAYNTFVGNATFRCIWGYNNDTSYTLSNFNFHHNDGNLATFSGYDSWNLGWDSNELINVQRVDNYYIAGSGKADWPTYYSTPDAAPAYGNDNIGNGISYYGSSSYVIPSGGITGNGIWICAWSGGGGYQNDVRVRLANFADIDNNYNSLELWASMVPYEGSYIGSSLYASPFQAVNTSTLYKQAKTVAHGYSPAHTSLWVRLGPTWTGSAGASVSINYSQENSATGVYATYTEPTDTQNNSNLYLDTISTNQTYKFSHGISVGEYGNISIKSSSSGILDFQSSGSIFRNDGSMFLITNNPSPISFYTNNRHAGSIDASGRWGLGNFVASTGSRLAVYGLNPAASGSDTFTAVLYDSVGSANFAVRDDGNIFATKLANFTTANASNIYSDGNTLFLSTSSEKYKKNISPYEKGLQDIDKLNAVTYQGKSLIDGDQFFAGFIAEDVYASGLSEFVSYNKSGEPNGLHYAQMTALLANGIKELNFKLNGALDRINQLEGGRFV